MEQLLESKAKHCKIHPFKHIGIAVEEWKKLFHVTLSPHPFPQPPKVAI